MKITHDFHTHTYLSVCGDESATIEYYVSSAGKHGLKKIGISDHMWDARIPYPEAMRHSVQAEKFGREAVVDWYRRQDIYHCREILPELIAADNAGIRFYFGGEVDYCPGIGAAITEEEAEKLEFMTVPNSHTHHLMYKDELMDPQKHADYMLRATMEICTAPTARYVTSLAHPFDAVCCPYPTERIMDLISDHQLEEVFCAAAEAGIAAEINTSNYNHCRDEEIRNHFMTRVLACAKNAGCSFLFGSDSHAFGEQDVITRGGLIADILGITEADLHPIAADAAPL